MSDFTIKIEDHSDDVMRELERRIEAALEGVGNNAVSHAKNNIKAATPRHGDTWYKSTGNLRNSLSHQVEMDEQAVYVGTNIDYAIYNEVGTGIYTEGGGGRQSPWAYKGTDGKWHRTRGITPIHFLKNAVANHIEEYKHIIENELKK